MVSSVLAEDGTSGNLIYSASKGAINAMVLPMARDLGKYKIRIMAIAPGLFLTPMTNIAKQKDVNAYMAHQTPWGRLGRS